MSPAAFALLTLLAGCAKAQDASEALVTYRQLVDRMCACQDQACVDAVTQELSAWGASPRMKGYKPPRKELMQLTALSQTMADCTSAHTKTTALDPGLPAASKAPGRTDKLMQDARIWASQHHARLHVGQVVVSYVGADGVLDTKHGELAVHLEHPIVPTDDPQRRTGAPVTARSADAAPDECPVLYWSEGKWTVTNASCRSSTPYVARCTPQRVWERAVARGAPSDALAVLRLDPEGEGDPAWTFTITDPPRKVAMLEHIVDDCEVAVEAP